MHTGAALRFVAGDGTAVHIESTAALHGNAGAAICMVVGQGTAALAVIQVQRAAAFHHKAAGKA